SSVWHYDIATGVLIRVAEMDRASAVTHALAADPLNTDSPSEDTPGGWESSGIIDVENILGRGAWLLDVQAHSLRINPVGQAVEGGPLLVLNSLAPSLQGSGASGTSRADATPGASGTDAAASLQLRVFPNPVESGSTKVSYRIGSSGSADVSIFDAAGRKVRT